MAGVGFDAFSAIGAMFGAPAQMRPETVDAIAFHFVIERAVDEVLRRSVNYPDDLSRLGRQFSTKVDLLRVVWRGNPDARETICDTLKAFNSVRNRVAHPADPRFEASMAHLEAMYRQLATEPVESPVLADIAQEILASLGDTNIDEMARMLDALSNLVNVRLPAAFGVDR